MRLIVGIVAAAALLTSCGGAKRDEEPAAGWSIGPVVNGKNKSAGAVIEPAEGAEAAFWIPTAPGHVHYVTKRHGPLLGAKQLRLRYRLEQPEGASLAAYSDPRYPAMLTLYFQQKGDTWTTSGEYETYRWYATFATATPIPLGEHEIVAPLDGLWGATQVSTSVSNPAGFQKALNDTARVGFVLGGGDGYGHGVQAVGAPARFTIISFTVE